MRSTLVREVASCPQRPLGAAAAAPQEPTNHVGNGRVQLDPGPLLTAQDSGAQDATVREETPTEEFARLLDDVESHRLRALPFDELRRLARLYRGETARLSRLRDRGGDLDQIAQLNTLCVRAHAFLYSARRRETTRSSVWRGLTERLSKSGPLVTLAWTVMAIGAFIGFFLVRLDPTALYALMPSGFGYDPAQIDALYSSESARDHFFAREATSIAENAVFGSFLLSNNTRVGILAFATGVLGGLPTLLLQFYNGIMVGTIAAIFLHPEHALLFLAWILPHGVPELTAITLCSAAGFALGRAVAAPGRSTRSEALREAGPTALALMLASLPLFLAAAWIESFIRQSTLGTAPRLGIAAAGVLVLGAIGLLIRRQPSQDNQQIDWLDRLLDATPQRDSPNQTAP